MKLGLGLGLGRHGNVGGFGFLTQTMTVAHATGAGDFTPDFTIDFSPAPEVGDVITLERSTSAGFATSDTATDTVDTVGPVNALSFDFGGNWTPDPQTWYVRFKQTRGASDIGRSNTLTILLTSADITAPVLSSLSITAVTATGATINYTADEAGTHSIVVVPTNNAPSLAQVEAGQTHLGAAASDSDLAQAMASGANTWGATGLAAETPYYVFMVARDAATNATAVTSVGSFTTAAAYVAGAVTFDGTNDWLARGAGLTGAADSKLLTMSFWFKSGANAGTRRFLACSTSVGGSDNDQPLVLKGSTNNEFRIQCHTSGGTTCLDIQSSNGTLEIADGWVHVMLSVDLADTGKRHLYINGASDLATVTTYTNNTMDFTNNDWGIMAGAGGQNKMSGDVADYYVAPGQYIDLSVQANREKFRSATGKPVDLGANGELPTGSAPSIFFSGDASTFATNKGNGGAFATNGTLTDAATSPSD